MSDVRTSELVINKLSKQQYENIQNPSDTELYLVPEDEEHKPICYPTTASEVKTTSMLVKSSVDGNGRMLTENGFVYNTSGNPTISDTKVVCDLGAGFFEKKLENLTMNTEYHIKSYGQNASGISYGSELVQRTLPNPIPAEYQLVEYLESTGTQYIDTNSILNVTKDTQFTIVFKLNTFSAMCVSGCENNGSQHTFVLSLTSGGVLRIYHAGLSAYNPVQLSIDTVYTLIMTQNGNVFTYNLNGNTRTTEAFWYQTYSTYALFGDKIKPNTINQLFNGKIYLLQVISDNKTILDLYPVYRIADNKPGMYDIVNNVFYTNQGTGEFVVGPDKNWDE